MRQVGGNLSLYALFEIMAATSKGPYRFGDSFCVRFAGNFRLVPSSQTLSPMTKGLYGLSLIQVSCALRCASWAASLASLMWSSLFLRVGTSVLLSGW